MIGLFILVNGSFFRYNTKYWYIGFYIIVTINLLILSLPILKGYAFYGRSDSITHLGYIKDIFLTGNVGIDNFYPLTHILISLISMLSRIDFAKIMLMMNSFFYILYALGLFLLSKLLNKNKLEGALLPVAFCIILPMGVYNAEFYPIGISFMLMPLIIYIALMRTEFLSFKYSFLFIIFLFSTVFIHPLFAIILIIILFLYGISVMITHLIKDKKFEINSIPLNSILITGVSLFAWISSYFIFKSRLTGIISWFNTEVHYSFISQYNTSLAKAKMGLLDTLILAFKFYGLNFVYLTIFSLLALWVIKNLLSKKDSLDRTEIFLFLGTITFTVIALTLFFIGFNLVSFPLRAMVPAFVFCGLFIGIILFKLISKKKNRTFSYFVVLFILFSLAGFGVFGLHASPWLKTSTADVSFGELSAVKWTAQFTPLNSKIISIASELPWRIRSYVYGYENTQMALKGPIKPSLGYNSSDYLADVYEESSILVVNPYDKKYYGNLWVGLGSISLKDFQNLENDITVHKIYDNNGSSSYYVRDIRGG
jgi:hypothetical protein